MNRLAVIGLLGLAGCSQTNGVCQPVFEATQSDDPVAMLKMSNEIPWTKTDAEACLHRNAYRLASSKDAADIVARAVVQACESEVMKAASLYRADAYDFAITVGRETTDGADARATKAEEGALKSYREYAMMRVVEGRAGNCKPPRKP
jgi:hypothetical protein